MGGEAEEDHAWEGAVARVLRRQVANRSVSALVAGYNDFINRSFLL